MRSEHTRGTKLGISEVTTARPVQAALTSASTFAVGAAQGILVAALGMLVSNGHNKVKRAS